MLRRLVLLRNSTMQLAVRRRTIASLPPQVIYMAHHAEQPSEVLEDAAPNAKKIIHCETREMLLRIAARDDVADAALIHFMEPNVTSPLSVDDLSRLSRARVSRIILIG